MATEVMRKVTSLHGCGETFEGLNDKDEVDRIKQEGCIAVRRSGNAIRPIFITGFNGTFCISGFMR